MKHERLPWPNRNATVFKAGSQLRAESLKVSLDFIRTDLELLFTFADIAETGCILRHHEHAEQTLIRAEQGYANMLHLFSEMTGISPVVKAELAYKFRKLRERLDSLQNRLKTD